MSLECVLCDARIGIREIGAMITVGDPANPDGAVVCRACAALPPDEQRRRRDAAMMRRSGDATADRLRASGAEVSRGLGKR
jgi:hypothetical protein